jgi:hypothetical protein
MTLPILILSITAATVLSAWWDTATIKKRGNLKGARKVFHLAAIYSVISALLIYRSVTVHDSWLIFLAYVLFAAFLYSIVKDMSMGYFLVKNILYLGNGWFDAWQKTWPPYLFWLFKFTGILVFLNFFRLFGKNKKK